MSESSLLRAREILALRFSCDGHADTFEHVATRGGDFLAGIPGLQLDLPRLRAAHQNLQIMAIYTTAKEAGPAATVKACRVVEAARGAVDRSDGRLRLILSSEDLDLGDSTGILLSLEGADPLVGELQMLHFFYRAGVRAIGLTHNHNSCAAGGCAPPDGVRVGLSEFGRDLVVEMGSLGMMLDTAHLGRQAFDDVMALAVGPVVNSHSCCRSIVDLERNLDDQQLRDIAQSGGLVAVTFVPKFLASSGQVSSHEVFRHLEHMVEVAGIDHVGIGSDFDGTDDLPVDLRQSSDLAHLVVQMLDVGWSEDAIGKVLGKNWVRILCSIL